MLTLAPQTSNALYNTLYMIIMLQGFLLVPFKLLVLVPILSFFSQITKILGSFIFVLGMCLLISLRFHYGRWEDGFADQIQYDSEGNVKTEIVKTPFVQVYHT